MARRLPPRFKKKAPPKGRPGAKPPGRRPAGPPRPRRDDAGPKPTGPKIHRPEAVAASEPERLNRFLARAGVGSRRSCEELILQGRVSINGEVVRELATKVRPDSDVVELDGQRIREERTVYFAVNKPKGYVSTTDDPAGRPRVIDLVAEVPERVYTVGRLDEDSTGLMLLTNDGELANRLAHPKFGVEKVYRALVAGLPERESLDQLIEGVWLSDGKARAKRVRIAGRRGEATMLELVLAEGKNREVRRMLAKLGHKVMTLQRVAVGPVSLKGLKLGDYRHLTPREVDLLRRVAAGETIETPGYGERDEIRMSRESAPRRGPARHERRPSPAPRTGRPPRDRDQETGPPRTSRPPAPRRARDAEGPPVGGPAVGRPARPPRPRAQGGPPPAGRPPQTRGPKRPARPSGPPTRKPPRDRDVEIQVGPEVEGLPLPPSARPRPTGPRGPAGGPGPRRGPARPAGGPPPRGPARPAGGPAPRGPAGGPAPRGPAGSPPLRGRRPSPSGGPPSRRIIGLETGGPGAVGEGPGGPGRPRRPAGPKAAGRPPAKFKARPKPLRKPRRERPEGD